MNGSLNSFDYEVVQEWNGGFKGEIVFTPGEETIQDWRIEFGADFEIKGLWHAQMISQEGNQYVLAPENENRRYRPGQVSKIIFTAKTTGDDSSEVDNLTFYDSANELTETPTINAPNPDTNNTPNINMGNETNSDSNINLNYSVLETWPGGFKSEFIFSPEGDSVQDWRLEMDGNFDIRGIWGAVEVSSNGDRIVLAADNSSKFQIGQSHNITIVADTDPGESSAVSNLAFYDGDGEMLDIAGIESPNPVTPPENPDPVVSPDPEPNPDPVTPPTNTSGETNYGSGQFRYGEAAQKSFLFYEAQRSGALPDDNRIEWRGDSALGDGSDVGLDLTGGYYDAGDHVKFGMPMAYSMTTLAWGGIEYKSAYKEMGQWDELKDAVKWGTDWILKAHINDGGQTQRVYVQVGDGYLDHTVWAPAETMTMDRPALYIDHSKPGSDLASDYAAALASASILFRGENDNYSNRLLNEAKQLYEFAENNLAKYSDSAPGASPYYTSWSGYGDELVWGANWLYKATGEQQYLDKAKQYGDQYRIHPGSGTMSWDDKTAGSAIMLAQTGDSKYVNIARQWLDGWMPGGGSADYTDGGFAWRSQWGSLRTTASTAFLAGVYHDTIEQNSRYHDFTQSQIDYMLGDNPRNSSYVVGFGDNPPERPHHRSASGAGFNNVNFKSTEPNEHILFGALVGGPQTADDWGWVDDRGDAVGNEVALDYNAGYTGALAYMYDKYGGDALTEAELDLLPEIDADGV